MSAFHAEPSHPQPAENALDFWDTAAPRVSEQFDQQKADSACPLRLVIHRWDFWHGGWHVARVAGCSWNILKHHLTRLYACRGLSLCLGGLDSAVCPEVAFFHLLMVPDGSFSKVVVFAAFLRQKFPIVASASMHTLETSRVEGFSHETLNHEWAPIGKRTSIAIYTVTLTQPSNLKLKLDWPGLPDTQLIWTAVVLQRSRFISDRPFLGLDQRSTKKVSAVLKDFATRQHLDLASPISGWKAFSCEACLKLSALVRLIWFAVYHGGSTHTHRHTHTAHILQVNPPHCVRHAIFQSWFADVAFPFAFACLAVLACVAELRSFTVALLRRNRDQWIFI